MCPAGVQDGSERKTHSALGRNESFGAPDVDGRKIDKLFANAFANAWANALASTLANSFSFANALANSLANALVNTLANSYSFANANVLANILANSYYVSTGHQVCKQIRQLPLSNGWQEAISQKIPDISSASQLLL